MMALEFEVTELHRRLANLIRLGRVVDADFRGAVPRLKIKIGELETAWLPMLQQRAGTDRSWWPIDINEQVLVFSAGGDLTQGVVLGSLSQQMFPAIGDEAHVHRVIYGDGAVFEYNRETHHLKMKLPSGATTEVVSQGGISFSGNLHVDGDISASGDVSDKTRSMQADRDIYNQHAHAGVIPGPASTSIPNPKQ